MSGGSGFLFQTALRTVGNNSVSIYERSGPQIDSGNAFSTTTTVKLAYHDNASFFQRKPSINGFAHPRGYIAHHGGLPTTANFPPIDSFAMTGDATKTTYTGTYTISEGGFAGDSQSHVVGTDVGFFLDGVNRDTDSERFYSF